MNKVGLLAAAAATLSASAPAEAVLLNFTITGDYSASFVLDSDPSPDVVDDGTSFTLWDVPGFPDAALGIADLQFWNIDALGGLTITDFFGGSILLDSVGAQLYAGPESVPTFIPGVYLLVGLFDDGEYTLTIAEAAPTVPEPASWAMMIAGLGLVGAAMRHSRRSVSVRFQAA